MLWFVFGTAVLTLLLASLRAFERATVTAVHTLLSWTAALGGIILTLLLLLSGRGYLALSGLAMVAPLLWRRLNPNGEAGPFERGPFPGARRGASAMSRAEAYDVLGLRPGATEDEIRAAHRRLMRGAHPDSGGSDWLASRINQARDVLLG